MSKLALWTKQEMDYIFGCSLPDKFLGSGVSIDTRTLEPGDIFVAIVGDQHDGHEFAKIADEKGASVIIASKPVRGVKCPVIMVDNTLDALRMMARSARLRSKAVVIAVTGSVGKTSTKEILRHTLSCFGTVSCAEASYNNHWGVPLSLSRLPRHADYAIFEIGMNNLGEIAPLSEMVRPNVAIITALAPAHIGNMGGMDRIVEEKSQIFVGLEPEGTAIISAKQPFYPVLKAKALKKFPKHVFSFGEEDQADVRLSRFSQEGTNPAHITIKMGDQEMSFTSPLIGRHLAINSLIAFAVAKALRLDTQKIGEAFRNMPALKNRCQVHEIDLKGGKKIILVDDSYNANLTSMTAGLEILMSITPQDNGRRIAVLGEMLELGSYAIDHHKKISDICTQKPIDKVFLCGGIVMKQGFSGLPEDKLGSYMEQSKDLIPVLIKNIKNNDVIFVKGSKGSKVTLVVEALMACRS